MMNRKSNGNRLGVAYTFVLVTGLLLSAWGFQQGAPSVYGHSNAPHVPEQPDNVACRPQDGKADRVRVSWDDTNEGEAEYHVYRKAVDADEWGDPVATVSDGTSWIDENAGGDVYHYRVTADDGDETTPGADQTCREPLLLDSAEGNYRMYYRLTECPDHDGKSVCTENINVDGNNKHAQQILDDSEDYRAELMELGFNDPGFFNNEKPFPLDFFPCNNGCANGDGIQYPPDNFLGTDYNPDTGGGEDYEVFVIAHEIFHKVQGSHGGGGADPFYKWLIEGQARSIEDKVCIFETAAQCEIWDEQVNQWYVGQVNSYLGKTEISLMEQSYDAALFWTYVVEQFADTMTVEPDYGMDVLLRYWQQNEENKDNGNAKDGIETLNDTLEQKIGSSRRFKDIFQDFAVAVYAKDLVSINDASNMQIYNFIDEENCPTCAYNKVKLTVDDTIDPDESILGTEAVDAWGMRYFELDLNPAVPSVHIKVEALAGTPHALYYHVLAIKNNDIVEQWSDEGDEFELSVFNIDPVYDRLVLVVAGMEHNVNFNYGFNLADGLFINTPNAQFQAQAGEATSPKKIMIQLEVVGPDQSPLEGIDTSQFSITVGSTVVNPPVNVGDNAIVASTYNAGKYWLVVRAPDSPGCTTCDLTVAYGPYTDTEADAIVYGDDPDTDNMIIIDRSGSMEGNKIEAAKNAAALYVDSYDVGDRIGVTSYNDAPQNEFSLTGWNNTTREQAQQAIQDLDDPDGATAIGAALRDGMERLVAQDSPNPAWSMVLLSDGQDTVEDTADHIPEFIEEYDARDDAGDQVPIIHVVAIGDDADGVALQQVTDEANGLFQWLPESSGLMGASIGAAQQTLFPLDLSEIYRVFAETVIGEQQIYAAKGDIVDAQSEVHTLTVDGGASQLVVSYAYVYTGIGIPWTIKIRQPDDSQIGPPTLVGDQHLVWRIPAPQQGDWTVTVSPIIPGVTAASTDQNPRTDFLVEASLISDLTMNVFLGLPIEDRIASRPMPILVSLTDIAAITGATVQATSIRTGEVVTLFDDGQHGDGAANDGFYGGLIKQTHQAGGYSVIVDADGTSQLSGDFDRRARVAFYMADAPDGDGDRLPDWWEGDCMDPTVVDYDEDPDNDDLINADEFVNQTDPCDPDTDDGGESDGSEVRRGNDPLLPSDDFNRPPRLKAWAGAGKVTVYVSIPDVSSKLTIYRATSVDGPFSVVNNGVEGNYWVDTRVGNGKTYCYRATAAGRATSGPSNISCATPNSDPYPPHGVITLQPGVTEPLPTTAKLILDGEDDPATEEHAPFDGALLDTEATESGVVEMQISNRADFTDVKWEPYATTKEWAFAPNEHGQATVYARFRDGAGNVSDVASLVVMVEMESVPVATETPVPTDTPVATSTPVPVDTPVTTATPTSTPRVTDTPVPSNTPQPTSTPLPPDSRVNVLLPFVAR
ncbi:MAG: VWA domain-containing protein [Chloroflexota bacterium]